MTDPSEWPDDLIQRLANREAVVVVGSGLSAGAQNKTGHSPPTWADLLLRLARRLTGSTAAIEKQIDGGHFLEAMEILRSEARLASRSTDLVQALKDEVDGPAPDHIQPASQHESLMRLEPITIVTTNFDRLLERASAMGYAVHSYNSVGLAAAVRRAEPVLIKLHGSVDDPENMVLSRTDFSRLRVQGSHVLEVVQALLLTRTVLFLGYSLRDPDMQLLLENAVGTRRGAANHYCLMGSSLDAVDREIMGYCYGVAPIFYPAGRFDVAALKLEELAMRVELARAGAQ